MPRDAGPLASTVGGASTGNSEIGEGRGIPGRVCGV